MQINNNKVNIHKEYWICLRLKNIAKLIVHNIKKQTASDDSKIEKYFQRAFTRWMFNVVRNNKNPFKDLITANDFLSYNDINYFFDNNPAINRTKLCWKWLDEAFLNIYKNIGFDESRKTNFVKIAFNSISVNFDGTLYELNKTQYQLAKEKYIGNEAFFNDYLTVIILRYLTIGTTNNHCSVPQNIVKYCKIHTELFGSPINTVLKQYCSPFYDVERYFNSLGSFFDYKLSTGTYLLNPPYAEDIINFAIHKIFEAMESNCEITVIIVLPCWDTESQSPKRKHNRNFPIINELKTYKYFRSHANLDCHTHCFYDYYSEKLIPVVNTHLFVISNTTYNFTAEEIANKWARGSL